MLTTRQKLDVVHRAWRYRLKTEPDEIALVRDIIRPGEVVLDIGAHKGAFMYWMGKSVGTEGRVLAFEPVPELVGYLDDSVDWLKLEIDVVPYALSDEPGKQMLYFPGFHMGSASLESDLTVFQEPIEISKRRLDDLLPALELKGPVSFIKCDVELHEHSVLRGAKETLLSDKPVLLFESNNLAAVPATKSETFVFLESIGFVGYFFDNRELVSISEFDSAKHGVPDDAYQNFVFTHNESVVWQSRVRPYKIERRNVANRKA